MSENAKWLRELAADFGASQAMGLNRNCLTAADEIERLTAENERLGKMVDELIEWVSNDAPSNVVMRARSLRS